MLSDSNLRSAVDSLWDKLWSGGLSNPLDAIEQLSFLLFLKRLDEKEQDNERAAQRRGAKFTPTFPRKELRWSHWTQLPADKALKMIKEEVFPFIKTLGGAGGSFAQQMENAEFKINKPSLLIEACKAIDALQISAQNQDVQGDLYEYLLSKLNTAGTNGQFRTPRHIIRMMVKMIGPRPGERVCDPAAGTCGFLVNAWQHLLESHTDPRDLTYDEEGYPHGVTGSKLPRETFSEGAQRQAITGYDSDSGMTMLRIGSMNLMLHGITSPNFRYSDTLSKAFDEERCYDIVLANPPFKGAIDATDVNPSLPAKVIAGLLHDALENHPEKTSRAEIERLFGPKVAAIVAGCTDTPEDYRGGIKPSWHERKERYLKHVRMADAPTRRVSMADKLDNARAVLADYRRLGDALWDRFNAGKADQLWYYRGLVDTFRAAGSKGLLIENLDYTVAEIERLCAASRVKLS